MVVAGLSGHVPVVTQAVHGKVARQAHSPQLFFGHAQLRRGTDVVARDNVQESVGQFLVRYILISVRQ